MGEWTKKFRELGKKGGSSKDFKKLYFKMKGSKSGSPVRDILIHDMMMSGAMQSELKKGGLVRKKPKLAKRGWK